MRSAIRKTVTLFIASAVIAAALFFASGSSSRADDTAYGEAAYGYLRTIFENYGFRINNNAINPDQSQKQAAGQWIHSVMTGLGYSGYTIESTDYERNHGNFIQDFCYRKQGASPMKVVIGAHYDSVNSYGVEDNGTGVSVLLELAKRFRDVATPLTIEFCFFDGEEFLGMGGSFEYAKHVLSTEKVNTLLYINLDSIGSGDNLYVYGGDYEGDTLVRDWGYNMAKSVASDLGIDLRTIPGNITRFRAPTRTEASDQFFFANDKIPYIYFEANAWVDTDGNEVYPQRPYNYNTNDPRVTATDVSIKGQIIHSVYDNLDTLETLFPGRVKRHMAEVSEIVTVMLKNLTTSSPARYAGNATPIVPTETETESATKTEPETETETEPETEAETVETESENASTVRDPDDETADPSDGQSDSEEGSKDQPSDGDPDRTEEAGPGGKNEWETTPADATEPGKQARPVTVWEVLAGVFAAALIALWIAVFVKFKRASGKRR